MGVAWGSHEGGFGVAIGCLPLAYQLALGWLCGGFRWLSPALVPPEMPVIHATLFVEVDRWMFLPPFLSRPSESGGLRAIFSTEHTGKT